MCILSLRFPSHTAEDERILNQKYKTGRQKRECRAAYESVFHQFACSLFQRDDNGAVSDSLSFLSCFLLTPDKLSRTWSFRGSPTTWSRTPEAHFWQSLPSFPWRDLCFFYDPYFSCIYQREYKYHLAEHHGTPNSFTSPPPLNLDLHPSPYPPKHLGLLPTWSTQPADLELIDLEPRE